MASTMGAHHDWTIQVTTRQDANHRWRAFVEVWSPERGPRTHNAMVVPFARNGGDEASIVCLGLTAARTRLARGR